MKLLATTETTYQFEGGVTLPRVTSILSIVHRFDGIPLDVLAHARDRGKAVHRAVWLLESGTGGGLARESLHPEVAPYVTQYEAAKRAMGFRVVASELLLVSQLYGFAGRGDLVIEWQGKRGLCDLKAAADHWTHRYQVSAYTAAWKLQEMIRARVPRWVLYLSPTAYRMVDLNTDGTQERDFGAFCSICNTYNLIQANGGNGQ